MLAHTTRSRLAGIAGLAGNPILTIHSRTLSTSPTLHHNMINLKDALSGKLRRSWTDEILTIQGLRNMNKLAAARAQASLKDKNAHNCNLLLTPSPVSLVDLPVVVARSWKAEASAALEIIEHEQRLALARAGNSVRYTTPVVPVTIQTPLPTRKHFNDPPTDFSIQDTWLALMGPLHRDVDHVSISFRLPSSEDPNTFKDRLRAAGLVGGKFQFLSRKEDETWKHFNQGRVQRAHEIRVESNGPER